MGSRKDLSPSCRHASRCRGPGQIDPAGLRATEAVKQQRFLRLEELGGGCGEYPREDLDLDVPRAGTKSDQTRARQVVCYLDKWLGSNAMAKLGQMFSNRKLARATYDSIAFGFICANSHPGHRAIGPSPASGGAFWRNSKRCLSRSC